jgi:hypothetical protein
MHLSLGTLAAADRAMHGLDATRRPDALEKMATASSRCALETRPFAFRHTPRSAYQPWSRGAVEPWSFMGNGLAVP